MTNLNVSMYEIYKKLCKGLAYGAVGNFWYENDYSSRKWKIYHSFMFTIIYSMVFVEILEWKFNGFPPDLHNDAISYGAGQIIVLIRINIIIHYSMGSRQLVQDMVKVCQGIEAKEEVVARYIKVRYTFIINFFLVFMTMLMFIMQAFRRLFEGEF